MLSNNQKFNRYLKVEYQPAQAWYKKSDSRKWIERNIPTLNELLEKNYCKLQQGVYCIQFNDIPVYVGEGVKASDRLLVHAHNLYREPLVYFGVEEEEINSGKVKIQVRILKEKLSDDELRKENELSCIKQLKPLLQKNDGTDICIPRRDRRKVIEKEIFNHLIETNKGGKHINLGADQKES
ncbi:hypothetical protein V6B14_22720 (plasmid) [Sporosarcina psychrophila]|uniref:hypothetical protein n=1 Tax=Sporosarcina psychrophila TaxID=1476 RepID=UPI0030D34728